MISRNLRHFRVFLAVADLGSPTLAASRCLISQPAVTQALGKLEQETGGALFDRSRQGFFLTERGRCLDRRIRRAMGRLDGALAEVAPRLKVTATAAQLQALIAMSEAQNFTLAARMQGLAQPTVHRAITRIEREAARALFERTSFGMVATPVCRRLAQAARLAFSEIEQAEADLADLDGGDGGRIVIGALPLSRSAVLPEALVRFRAAFPTHQVSVLDGTYDDMLAGLRRGDIDLMIGALRDPLPIGDVTQEALFHDRLAILARPGHPLAGQGRIPLSVLAAQQWVVPRQGTPSRACFDALFAAQGGGPPDSILDCGSILLMREVLNRSDLLGCISAQQARAEIARGLLVRLDTAVDAALDRAGRSIGLTCRADWVPTKAQGALLDLIRDAARGIGTRCPEPRRAAP